MNNEEQMEYSSPPCLSRDISWVDFNERVLREGLRKDMPLLERLRFLSIVSSNFDEFFMVRVAALKRMQNPGQPAASDPCGLTTEQQLKIICKKVHSIIERQYECMRGDIFPGLAESGLSFLTPDSCSVSQLDFLNSYFIGQVYPVLTPLRMEDDKPLPFIEKNLLHAAFLLESENTAGQEDSEQNEKKVIVPLPHILDRIIRLPGHCGIADNENEDESLSVVLLEDVIITWGAYLFPGFRVKESMLFKINRDADFSVDEQRDEDFIDAMTEVLENRGKSNVVRMVYSSGSEKLKNDLSNRFSLDADYIYEINGPINLADFLELAGVAGMEKLAVKPWKIYQSTDFAEEMSIFDRIGNGDVMLHFPYQSFDPVVRFFQEAAVDPQVISIKTALYRTGGAIPENIMQAGSLSFSPVVRALEQAALNGKQVTAVVELKARFDEERNISWANRLEKAGVIVVYGLSHLKVHAKITIILRRENDRVKRYVHLSTGNYNDRTAKIYEDICIFTCREDIAYDAGLLFNMLTGYSAALNMMKMTAAPSHLKRKFLELINRETNRAKHDYPAKIMAKLNSLTDIDIIKALYDASKAGVKISLCVRGICRLIPEIPEVSENIKVISVIDRYLEHSRIYYFDNGGSEEIYLASADWMTRNLERRVELLFPVQDEKIRNELKEVISDYFLDNCKASILDGKGVWTALNPSNVEKPFRIQKEIHSRVSRKNENFDAPKLDYNVRRSPPINT